jgi:hypothetical protein
MGAKTFNNLTGLDLNIEVTVRAGDEVGTAFAVSNIFLQANAGGQVIEYGDDNDPYLDGIIANAVNDPNISGEIYVYEKDDTGDDTLNTNDTVTFSLQDGTTIILNCTNSQ